MCDVCRWTYQGRSAVCPCSAMGVSPVWDGTLSPDGFNASAAALIKRWKEIEVDDSLPDWTWKPCCKLGVPSEEEGYLALEGVYHSCEGSQVEESNDFDGADVVADDTWVQSSSDAAHVYDFHVVYSYSYKVPVLYFQAHLAGGQLLTLDEIKQDLPSNSFKVLSDSKWTFITREEHPHLSRPWFTLHPCATSDWMKLLLEQTKEQSLQYLPAWLSVVGQAVGLKIPPELHCNS
ncbi:ubiquitin-like-conjugating enzyme ATG10 isoform X2 [Phragmites australis]|uniref:ubiquitin-like-conjugating enzyme ATG10 isoform X2 n=1 Tax=Phragmites australis TaxID=29695 RepID=UPI002D78995A|nr:ubiquitin-like-conjugating enzyme ATG10 isoform X2 [Phragmites australis]